MNPPPSNIEGFIFTYEHYPSFECLSELEINEHINIIKEKIKSLLD